MFCGVDYCRTASATAFDRFAIVRCTIFGIHLSIKDKRTFRGIKRCEPSGPLVQGGTSLLFSVSTHTRRFVLLCTPFFVLFYFL